MNSSVRIFPWVLFLPVFAFGGKAKEISIAEQAGMIVTTAEKYHYQPRPVNDSFSEVVYKSFLNMLDPYGILFTDETMEKLDSYKYALDDQIKQQKTALLEAVAPLYLRQLHVADSLVHVLKNKEIDISSTDTLWLGGDAVYGKQALLSRKWEQWIKYMILWSYQNNKDTTGTKPLLTQKETRKFLDDAITREACRIQQKMNPVGGMNEYLGVRYLKAIASAFDPHTQYMSFAEKTLFETDLSKESGSFGILVNFNVIGEIEIVRVIPGGPAWNSNKINEGDIILDIKKSDGTTIDLRCATLAAVHAFLSSIWEKPTGFKIRKKGGKIITVTLTKELLDVEKNTIRSYILKGGANIGYIYLPSFYTDFMYENYISKGCANDMAKELIKLKKDAVSGLILDVRSNGGGSLEEAARLAGIFIDYGAISIIHSRGKDPEIVKDNARGMIFNGPLIVLTNFSSASASEMFAGVLQDYNRALIVGAKTFGKSTMQVVVPVDAGNFDSLSHYKGEPPGYLTLTTGCFYRVTGASHQKVGIVPDIELPQVFENALDREASYTGALEFGKISKKAYYYPGDPLPVGKVKALCSTRLKDNPGFKYIKKTGALIPKINSRYPVPLSFQSFSKFVTRFEELEDSFTVKKGPFTTVLPEYVSSRSSMTKMEKADNDTIMRNIGGDIYVNEAYTIMNDLISNTTGKEGK
jgi:carboxyl-terminal processing protease